MRAVVIVAHFVTVALVSLLCSVAAHADPDGAAPLAARIGQIPPSFGSNYTITMRRGETWMAIGMREHVGYEQLRRANPHGIKPGPILIPGRHIAPESMETGVVVNVPELTLYYLEDGQVTHWFPVSVGMVADRWHTRPYSYTIANRVENPTWYIPPFAGGGSMPPGPKNPLGDRVLYLAPLSRMVAIHGTNDISCIGKYVSHSCIRMFPLHIHELFELVNIGMPVETRYDTVKVGEQNGIVYLAIFPDVYHVGTNAPEVARARLDHFGVGGAVSDAELQAHLARPDGVARPILGSAVPVKVNGAAVNTPIGPTLRNGVYYLPLPALAGAIGAQTDADTVGQSPAVAYRGTTVAFPADGTTAFRAFDTVFVSTRKFAESFGGAVSTSDGGLHITVPTEN